MSSIPIGANEWARWKNSSELESPHSEISTGLRIMSMMLRAVFIALLLIMIVHVSMPESKTVWRAYEMPGDLIRMVSGFVVCVWIAVQLFAMHKDAEAYRTWFSLGLAAVPFTLICMVGIW